MRSSRLRPRFDCLDSRLLLDGNGSVAIGTTIGNAVISTASNSGYPGDGSDLTGAVNWYCTGNPTDTPYDPMCPPVTCMVQVDGQTDPTSP